jgi:glucose-1-phosphate cytidylyltransferase
MGDFIKSYFLDLLNLSGHVSIDFAAKRVRREDAACEDWRVHLVETGAGTLTGGRIQRLQRWLGNETFLATYGDGLSNVNLAALVEFHRAQGRIATVTAVRPPARFGGLNLDGPQVASFTEKPVAGEGWINGGFLVFEPEVFDYLDGDACSLEAHALERLAADGQLAAYRHDDFWQCMDTMRDKHYLEKLWREGAPPWRTWPSSAAGPDNEILPLTTRRAA